jgi:phenylacetyl-CoA:acceptor oxidoreductase subunit 2
LFVAGTVLPLIGIALAASGLAGAATATALVGAAGLLAALAGAWFKFTLVTRGGFNQGFGLTHLPVRGAR